MMRRKPTRLDIGSVSSGTMRPEDLLPALLWECDRLHLAKSDRQLVRDISRASNATWYWEGQGDTDPADDVDELFRVLENYVPDYCYFGAAEGDGADYGCWISWDTLERDAQDGTVYKSNMTPAEMRRAAYDGEAHGIKYSDADRAELLADYKAITADYWLYVTDHGNATLFRRSKRGWIEVWSVV